MSVANKKINTNNVCSICGSKIKKESNSLHVWEIEYDCGTKIWGGLDYKTHGNKINYNKKCNK